MCDSLTSSSSFRRTRKKTRDDDDGKNEEKHNNNNGIVFDDDDDDVKVVFEDVPLPRRALSSSTFSFVVKRFRLERSTSKSSLYIISNPKLPHTFRVLRRK